MSTEDQKKSGAENESSEPKGQELVYMAKVALAGRRVIEYLLSPIFKHKQEVAREIGVSLKCISMYFNALWVCKRTANTIIYGNPHMCENTYKTRVCEE
jgi:hypothetical protein